MAVVLALVAVVAIALAAATLNDTVVPDESGGTGTGSSGDVGAGERTGESVVESNSSGRGSLGTAGPRLRLCVEVLTRTWVQALIVGGALVAGYVVTRRLNVIATFAFGGAFGLPLLLVYLALTNCGGEPSSSAFSLFPGGANNSSMPAGGVGGFEQGASVTTSPVAWLLVVVLGGALVVSVALLLRAGEDEDRIDPPDEPDPTADPEVAAVGRAAGRAADRIEAAADLDNEVYRAWDEMTTHLDVDNPDASTPAEFAAAAAEAGMAREDVDELTRLFEEVRYGGVAATPDREARAVSALRRIESTYAGAEA